MLLRSPDAPPRGWSSVPQPLTDTVVSMAEGTTLSYYGYSFDVPWRAIDKERNEGRAVELFFKTGQTIRFYNPEYSDRNPIDGVASHVDRNDFRLESANRNTNNLVPSYPLAHRNYHRFAPIENLRGLWSSLRSRVCGSNMVKQRRISSLSRPIPTVGLKSAAFPTIGKTSRSTCSIKQAATGSQSQLTATLALVCGLLSRRLTASFSLFVLHRLCRQTGLARTRLRLLKCLRTASSLAVAPRFFPNLYPTVQQDAPISWRVSRRVAPVQPLPLIWGLNITPATAGSGTYRRNCAWSCRARILPWPRRRRFSPGVGQLLPGSSA
jgi:hypothetical protein